MASFKLYLDTRHPRKDGMFPLKIAVHHKGRFLINLKVYIRPENLIGNEIIIPESRAQQKNTNDYVRGRLVYVENTLRKLMLLGELQSMTDAQLKRTLDTNALPEEERPPLLRDHYLEFIEKKTAPGTKAVYRHTLDKIGRFCDLDTLKFEDIDIRWLDAFDAELSKTCKTNTRSIHMRNIRAVINHAIDRDVIPQNLYPFRKFKIKHERTRKRSLTVEQLRTLRDYPCEPHQEQYRDMFMLIFYLIGINSIDLFHLKKIVEGRVDYTRAKTGRPYYIKVEPEALAIIEKYRGEKYLLNVLDRYDNYKDYLHRMNDNLQKIGPIEHVENATKPKGKRIKTGPLKVQYNGLFPDLTTYWARHTWATIAAGLDIPKETIAAGLGHEIGNTTTSIYIDFDQKKVDEANRKVIDFVNEGKK